MVCACASMAISRGCYFNYCSENKRDREKEGGGERDRKTDRDRGACAISCGCSSLLVAHRISTLPSRLVLNPLPQLVVRGMVYQKKKQEEEEQGLRSTMREGAAAGGEVEEFI